MPPTQEREKLTLDDVEQVGRLLIPSFRQAMAEDLQAAEGRITAAFGKHQAEAFQRIRDVEDRVTALERIGMRMLGISAGIGAVIAIAIEMFKLIWKHG